MIIWGGQVPTGEVGADAAPVTDPLREAAMQVFADARGAGRPGRRAAAGHPAADHQRRQV